MTKTRLEILCDLYGQNGGTIHQFNEQYKTDILAMNNLEFFKLVLGKLYSNFLGLRPDIPASSHMANSLLNLSVAIDNGTFDHTGHCFKQACKLFGFKGTRKSITEYIYN